MLIKPWLYSVAGLVGFLLVSYAVIRWGFALFMPFLVAALLAELINPLVDRLADPSRRLRLPRGLATALVLAVVAGLAAFGLILAIARLVREIQELAQALPYYYAIILDLANRVVDDLRLISHTLPDSVRHLLEESLGNIQNLLRSALPGVATTLQAFAGVPGLLVDATVVLVATFFISRDRRVIGRFLLGLLPAPARPKVRQVKNEVWASAMGFARAQLILVSTTMLLTIAGLLIIGAEYAVLMGILVGVADLLPVAGPALVYVPWITFQFATGHTGLGVRLLVLYGVAFVVRQVLEPRLVAANTGQHPLTTLISMYLGFRFFGGIGVVMGPLLAILLAAMIRSGLLPIFQTPDE